VSWASLRLRTTSFEVDVEAGGAEDADVGGADAAAHGSGKEYLDVNMGVVVGVS
jgi:hypothetical protein